MLITQYEKRPFLWDVGHKDYMNRNSKELAFSHRGSKAFCLLDANLATPGNITRNNTSATMFPILARPYEGLQGIVPKSVPHVHHAYFLQLDQSDS